MVAASVMEKYAKSYPRYIMTSAFGSLLLKSDEQKSGSEAAEELTMAYLAYQIEFSKVVSKKSNPERKKWTNKKWNLPSTEMNKYLQVNKYL